jgi:hypothetical protein
MLPIHLRFGMLHEQPEAPEEFLWHHNPYTWNRRAKVLEVRRDWAEMVNRHLERAGHVVRVDHRH